MASTNLESTIQDHENRIRIVEKTLNLIEQVEDHEGRIRILETSRVKFLGAVAGASAFGSILAFVMALLGAKLVLGI
ncbi:hypothetical protein [Vulgatibacter incomptus]|uniref:Uncharacterized protein n=1 Tax=Vulgatibacter incomptus TaxID=1391653 RepID=A0A0K1PBA2_9BACT|nr:hypothetical protein [Vulgatibacter incomptus]AKU90767.1 hypothetical protein AKJ08_1154 [Vulgatibacter incomptus]